MTTLAPSSDLQQTHVPMWPGYAFIQAVDYAVRRAMARMDLSGLGDWYEPSTIPEEVLASIMRLYGIGGLDTMIFGPEHRRALLSIAYILLKFRGTEYILQQYAAVTGLTYTHVLVRNDVGRATGIQFTVTPPLRRSPGTNWEVQIRSDFEWMVPPDLTILTFDITVTFESEFYITSWFHAEAYAF